MSSAAFPRFPPCMTSERCGGRRRHSAPWARDTAGAQVGTPSLDQKSRRTVSVSTTCSHIPPLRTTGTSHTVLNKDTSPTVLPDGPLSSLLSRLIYHSSHHLSPPPVRAATVGAEAGRGQGAPSRAEDWGADRAAAGVHGEQHGAAGREPRPAHAEDGADEGPGRHHQGERTASAETGGDQQVRRSLTAEHDWSLWRLNYHDWWSDDSPNYAACYPGN